MMLPFFGHRFTYHSMFKQNSKAMKRSTLENTLKQLVDLHKIPLKYYSSSRSNPAGWKEVDLLPKKT